MDRIRFSAYAESEDLAEQNRAEQAFEMVLIPGDPQRGIEPFYLSKTEVRLEMFYPWASGIGMGWSDDEVKQRIGFWPSEYLGFYYNYQWLYDDQYPALAMSRTVAELYCQSLSEMTGRVYRLPTEAQWDHALRLSGGVPEDEAELLEQAHLFSASEVFEQIPFGPVPAKVGRKFSDRLGLHDLLGNAAEWVTDTGKQRVAKGGHYALAPNELTAGWRAVENIDVWQSSYPNLPRPSGLYFDFPYTGIRLACDADQAPVPLKAAPSRDP